MPINRSMDKEDVVHTHNGILFSHKGMHLSQFNLEPIIQSEVSQKEKYKYRTLIHIYGNLKRWY